ncbi:MAG: DUF3035 domain-containing protein [Hyphomonadaceae bacterium]
MTTKQITTVVMMAAAAASLSGCGISRALGAAKVSPDEFRVVTSAPLTLPPDYALRPPRPGEPRPQEMDPDAEARAVLFGQDIATDASAGERALVNAAGADATDPGIRDTIDFEAQSIVRRNQSFADRVIHFTGSQNTAAPLNAEEEQRRLEEEESIRPATGGGQVTIERDRGGFKLPGT